MEFLKEIYQWAIINYEWILVFLGVNIGAYLYFKYIWPLKKDI